MHNIIRGVPIYRIAYISAHRYAYYTGARRPGFLKSLLCGCMCVCVCVCVWMCVCVRPPGYE